MCMQETFRCNMFLWCFQWYINTIVLRVRRCSYRKHLSSVNQIKSLSVFETDATIVWSELSVSPCWRMSIRARSILGHFRPRTLWAIIDSTDSRPMYTSLAHDLTCWTVKLRLVFLTDNKVFNCVDVVQGARRARPATSYLTLGTAGFTNLFQQFIQKNIQASSFPPLLREFFH